MKLIVGSSFWNLRVFLIRDNDVILTNFNQINKKFPFHNTVETKINEVFLTNIEKTRWKTRDNWNIFLVSFLCRDFQNDQCHLRKINEKS